VNGGQTAIELAIRHPEKVRRLVVASAFFKRSGTPAGFWAGFARATLDNGSYLGEALTTNPNMKTVELLAAMIDEFLS
jgi:pimeloyl-ACP methyl ester carboxylesterase